MTSSSIIELVSRCQWHRGSSKIKLRPMAPLPEKPHILKRTADDLTRHNQSPHHTFPPAHPRARRPPASVRTPPPLPPSPPASTTASPSHSCPAPSPKLQRGRGHAPRKTSHTGPHPSRP